MKSQLSDNLSCCFSNTGLKSRVLNLMILDEADKTSGQPKSDTPSTNYKSSNLIMYKIKWLKVKSTLTVSLNCVLTSCVFTSENSGKAGRCRNSKLNDPNHCSFLCWIKSGIYLIIYFHFKYTRLQILGCVQSHMQVHYRIHTGSVYTAHYTTPQQPRQYIMYKWHH